MHQKLNKKLQTKIYSENKVELILNPWGLEVCNLNRLLGTTFLCDWRYSIETI